MSGGRWKTGVWGMKAFEGTYIRAALVVRQTEGFRRAVIYITGPMSALIHDVAQYLFRK